jgi:hypothetical protein
MAKKPTETKSARPKKGDTEKKGKIKSGRKVTSIGDSRNTRKNNKDAVRERKGHP